MARASHYETLIVISSPRAGAKNAFNEVTGAGAEVCRVYAKKTDVSDGEKIAAGQTGAGLRSRFVVRSSAKTRAIEPDMILKIGDDGSDWNIVGVKAVGKGRGNREVEITAIGDLNDL